MADLEDYARRLAREERERELARASERRTEEREEERWLRGKLFEASKHMTTLATSALARIIHEGG